jgi:dTDP-4-amino-4,6-dideoxygalactose transaminase
VLLDPGTANVGRDALIDALEEHNIESRPVWKPMHIQPVYATFGSVGGAVAEGLFDSGVALPSGSGLSDDDIDRVISVVRSVLV